MTKIMTRFIIFLISISFFNCGDGAISVRGYVVNNFNKSQIICDSLFESVSPLNKIENSQVLIYPYADDSLIYQGNFEYSELELFSDSTGYFEGERIVAPGSGIAAIVTSKSGYNNDTIFFKYWAGDDRINLIINLKR